MKIIKSILLGALIVSFVSCASTQSKALKKEQQVAGYTLKNKKELLQQKVLHKTQKTLVAKP